jgi:excisionase family DNA binding protein
MSHDEQLLNIREAADALRVSTSWLYKQVAARSVPCTRLGRSVRFSRANLAAIVAASTNEPMKTRRTA